MRFPPPLTALIGFSAILTGAFGAHALKSTLTAHDTLSIWQTACQYHLVHAVAILTVTVIAKAEDTRLRQAAAWWTLGIVLFSGSLYGLALGAPRWLGPITPLGGVALMIGWILVAFARRPNASQA